MPTSVGLRYGQSWLWLEAFLGGIGGSDFRTLARTRPGHHRLWKWDLPHLPTLTRSPACPFAGFTCLSASPLRSISEPLWCRNMRLLAIAYDYNVLGLGPD